MERLSEGDEQGRARAAAHVARHKCSAQANEDVRSNPEKRWNITAKLKKAARFRSVRRLEDTRGSPAAQASTGPAAPRPAEEDAGHAVG